MKKINSKKNLENKIKEYSALAAGIFVTGNIAQGQIAYTDIVDFTCATNQSYQLDLNADATPDFRLFQYNTAKATNDVAVDCYGNNSALANVDDKPLALSNNYLIKSNPSGGNNWQSGDDLMLFHKSGAGTSSQSGLWKNQDNKYLGLKLVVCGKPYYGWARLKVPLSPTSVLIYDYAYQSYPDVPIKAGATSSAGAVIAATNIVASDISNNHNGTDLQVTFDKASSETGISEYRVFIVKSADAGSFSIASSKCDTNYISIVPTGNNIDTSFNASTKDADGDLIAEGVAYKLFVLSLPDGSSKTDPALSAASNEITLTIFTGIKENSALSGINIYTANKKLYVKLNSTSEECTLKIINMSGQEVRNMKLTGNNNTEIALEDLNTGIYNVYISNGKEVITKRIFLH